MIDILIAFCLLSGAFFMLVAAIGILKLPDLYQQFQQFYGLDPAEWHE